MALQISPVSASSESLIRFELEQLSDKIFELWTDICVDPLRMFGPTSNYKGKILAIEDVMNLERTRMVRQFIGYNSKGP